MKWGKEIGNNKYLDVFPDDLVMKVDVHAYDALKTSFSSPFVHFIY